LRLYNQMDSFRVADTLGSYPANRSQKRLLSEIPAATGE
jgi:hypothetical protein